MIAVNTQKTNGDGKLRERERSLVVEFCGLGGSGKTTVAKKLADKLMSEGYSVYPRWEPAQASVSGDLTFRLKNIFTFFKVLALHWKIGLDRQGGVRPWAVFSQYLRNARKINRYWRMMNRRCDGGRDLILFDQGVINWVGSVVPGALIDRLNVGSILRRIYSRGKVIVFYVQADVDVAVKRMRARKATEGKGLGKRADVYLDAAVRKKSTEKVVKCISQFRNVRVVAIDGEGDPDVSAETAMSEVLGALEENLG